jgi:hypothetical protein
MVILHSKRTKNQEIPTRPCIGLCIQWHRPILHRHITDPFKTQKLPKKQKECDAESEIKMSKSFLGRRKDGLAELPKQKYTRRN